jgi:hypothetical protein
MPEMTTDDVKSHRRTVARRDAYLANSSRPVPTDVDIALGDAVLTGVSRLEQLEPILSASDNGLCLRRSRSRLWPVDLWQVWQGRWSELGGQNLLCVGDELSQHQSGFGRVDDVLTGGLGGPEW